MRRLLNFIILSAALICLVSCRPKVPSKYIQPGEMEDILYDYHVAQAMALQRDQRDLAYNQKFYQQAVFKKYDITEAQFDSSLVYYLRHTERLHVIYENLAKRLSEDALQLGATESDVNKYSALNSKSDTTNLWSSSKSAVLIPVPPYNKITFRVKADTAFHKEDRFSFNFTTNFIFQDGMKEAIANLVIRYDNDSIASQINHISSNGNNELMLGNDPNHKIKEISGFIFLTKGGTSLTTLKLMFIDNIQLIRMHKTALDRANEAQRISSSTPSDNNTQHPLNVRGQGSLPNRDTTFAFRKNIYSKE